MAIRLEVDRARGACSCDLRDRALEPELLGGMLIDALGWRSAFWFSLGAGIAITAAVFVILSETRPEADVAQQSPQMWRNYVALLRQPVFTALTGLAPVPGLPLACTA